MIAALHRKKTANFQITDSVCLTPVPCKVMEPIITNRGFLFY